MTTPNSTSNPTLWQQLRVSAEAGQAEAISAALTDSGALAVTFIDGADNPVLEPDPGTTPLWQHTTVVALFSDEVALELGLADLQRQFENSLTCRRETVEDQDWSRTCLQDFKPQRFGHNLWICPSWDSPPDSHGITVKLDPGLAFGTGSHPTTALCLEWLAMHSPHNKTVIDFGCGSGILAIAAACLGAHHVYAIDHDPQALLATQDNALKNDVSTRISVATPATLPSVPSDVIIANILLEPLIDLTETFYRLLKPHGHLVISGILSDQLATIAQKYAPQFKIHSEQTMENWVCLNFVRT